MAVAAPVSPRLVPGRTYTWDELGRMFNFKPRYLSVAGGMLPRPAMNALLLVTWPGGARSFDYDDYWSQGDLIYTGRGKTGDQKLEGANRDLANNSRTNYVFEGGAGSGALRFLGVAVSTRRWRARGMATTASIVKSSGSDFDFRREAHVQVGARALLEAVQPERARDGDRAGITTESGVDSIRRVPLHSTAHRFSVRLPKKPPRVARRRARRTTRCSCGSRPNSSLEGGQTSTRSQVRFTSRARRANERCSSRRRR
jgi:hypothetical protein